MVAAVLSGLVPARGDGVRGRDKPLDMPPTPDAAGGAFFGDEGHFIYSSPPMYVLNPDGRAFTVRFPVRERGDGEKVALQVSAPDGEAVAFERLAVRDGVKTVLVPPGPAGVYTVRHNQAGYLSTWIRTSLEHGVIFAGDWEMRDGWRETFKVHPMVPRRWYMYVPEGVERFFVKHIIMPFQSHRENYGFLVVSPMGQIVDAFYGGKPQARERDLPNIELPVEREIEVDPGARGRFWSLWVTGGGSHSYSHMQILVSGIPPYFAPTPEQWFNPETGEVPAPLVYDTSEVLMRGRDGLNFYRWIPAPFFGADGYTGFRQAQTFHLFNPENRALTFGVSSYLTPPGQSLSAVLRAFDPEGLEVARTTGDYGHRRNAVLEIPPSGAGVTRVEVDATSWYPWHRPAVPIVIEGKAVSGGGARFEIETSNPRYWFFKVPAGTQRFGVGFRVHGAGHAVLAEVHAPDRMMDVVQVRGGGDERRLVVDVPEGLDGKVWFVATSVASATRLVTQGAGLYESAAQLRIALDLTLYDVPGFLAPTQGQWFDPRKPGAQE